MGKVNPTVYCPTCLLTITELQVWHKSSGKMVCKTCKAKVTYYTYVNEDGNYVAYSFISGMLLDLEKPLHPPIKYRFKL